MKAVLWSGGLDSTVLVEKLLDEGQEFDLVTFREFWPKDAEKYVDDQITRWGLKTYSYPAADRSFIGQGDEITAVFDYAVGGTYLPVLRDVVEGTRCIAELETVKMSYSPLKYDTYFVGTRKEDSHYAVPRFEKEWTVGNARIVAPLYDLTREDILRMAHYYGVNPIPSDTGDIELCTRCLRGKRVFCPAEKKYIPPIDWSPEVNLAEFQKR